MEQPGEDVAPQLVSSQEMPARRGRQDRLAGMKGVASRQSPAHRRGNSRGQYDQAGR